MHMLGCSIQESAKFGIQPILLVNPAVPPRRYLIALIVTAITGCSTVDLPSLETLPGPSDLPFIHKIDIQQGNILTQEMLSQLRPGMDKKKILFIMGSPIIEDTFNANRWDYVYTYMPGGGQVERRSITLVFADDKLAHVEGDVLPATEELTIAGYTDMTVEVPLYQRKSYVDRLRDRMPFTEAPEIEPVYDVKDLPNAKDIPPGAKRNSTDDSASGSEKNEATNKKTSPAKEVLVPRDTPASTEKKGFFHRILVGIGIGAENDDAGDPAGQDPVDPKYRDITNPDNY